MFNNIFYLFFLIPIYPLILPPTCYWTPSYFLSPPTYSPFFLLSLLLLIVMLLLISRFFLLFLILLLLYQIYHSFLSCPHFPPYSHPPNASHPIPLPSSLYILFQEKRGFQPENNCVTQWIWIKLHLEYSFYRTFQK